MTLASKTWPTYRGTVAYAKPEGRLRSSIRERNKRNTTG